AAGQLALGLFQADRLGHFQAQGALDQQAGALAALINGERLGNRLEVADLQAGLLQGADQPEADRVETTAKAGGGEKQRMHGVSFGGVTPPEWARSEEHTSE